MQGSRHSRTRTFRAECGRACTENGRMRGFVVILVGEDAPGPSEGICGKDSALSDFSGSCRDGDGRVSRARARCPRRHCRDGDGRAAVAGRHQAAVRRGTRREVPPDHPRRRRRHDRAWWRCVPVRPVGCDRVRHHHEFPRWQEGLVRDAEGVLRPDPDDLGAGDRLFLGRPVREHPGSGAEVAPRPRGLAHRLRQLLVDYVNILDPAALRTLLSQSASKRSPYRITTTYGRLHRLSPWFRTWGGKAKSSLADMR